MLSFLSGISLILPNKDGIHYHYFILMLYERVENENIRVVLYYLYKLLFIKLFPIMTINSLRILYASRKLKFQMILLEGFIETMTKDYNIAEMDDYKIVYNENYQKI